MPSSKLFFLSLFSCLLYLLIVALNSEIPVDTGDGIMHFYISEAAWQKPILLLDHWGKPLFTLLSSPFSQFGFKGILVFQILTFVLTCLFALEIFKKLGVSIYLSILFPFFLVLTNDYFATILSALTEPLFNLFTVVILYCLIHKKWLLFSVLASFTLYLRSEGQLVVLLAFFILILNFKIKYIPFLAIGFLLYGLVGFVVLDDFWWYFTKSPYDMSNNIYGKGTWFHYIASYKNYIGNHGLVLFVISFISLVFYFRKLVLNKETFSMYLIAYGVFFGVLFSHSYFWATGQNGSIGLTRITTQGMPLFLIINLYHLNLVEIKKEFVKKKPLKILLVASLTFLLFTSKPLKIQISNFDIQVKEASLFLQKHAKKTQNFYYHHPLISYFLKHNPFLETNSKHYYGGGIENELGHRIKIGDFLVWDSHFCPTEGQMPMDKISKLNELVLVNQFTFINDKNEEEGIFLFQYQKNDELLKVKEYKKNITFSKKNISSKNEFEDIAKISSKNYPRKLILTVNGTKINSFFVCCDPDLKNYQAIKTSEKSSLYNFNLLPNLNYSLYYWNPKKTFSKLEIISICISEKVFPKMI